MTRAALIVSHGQPSDPEPAEAALAALAERVAGHLPGWQVASATLAKPGALAAAVAGRVRGLVYPMFMAGGWFPMTELPRRMDEVGALDWAYLPPFGLDPGVQGLAETVLVEASDGARARTEVLLAAHGSFRSSAPAAVARAVAQRLKRAGFARVEACFIDEEPRIAGAVGFGPGSLCLPFFAAEGGHVSDDLPEALAEAGFAGRVLPPLGLDARVPGLIAAALQG
ncbi:MAG: cobalamin biosynthesis protein CbiX [Rhodobacterales bacterium 17-64-5]|nr:MAG: cobalamin biosynthesis protein CbiX [Rhodobacterales bacterium 17-64-5]